VYRGCFARSICRRRFGVGVWDSRFVTANQKEIETTYDWLDDLHEIRLGAYADLSCAFFDGDFKKTLAQAQKDKHDWVFKELGIGSAGKHILDIGCGWGPILNAIRVRGGAGIGITLSRAQAKYCSSRGLDAKVLDWKETDPRVLGKFEGVISVGAFEHFCSPEEFERGEQWRIYKRFFDFCADVLPLGGKLYLQTMIWGKKVPVPNTLSFDAPEGSPERILARLRKFYPGSWAPTNIDQIKGSASRRFKLLSSNNGRKDYIETLNRWGEGTRSVLSFRKFSSASPVLLRLAGRYLTDHDFRIQMSSIWHNDQQRCFIDEIMTHERMFFEKVA
jgi:cyclopropane-fatty-acyl-phospholipid synthase